MPDFVIRDAVPADHQAMAEVHRVCHPALLVSAESIAHATHAYADADLAQFVAESGGRVIGVGSAFRNRWTTEEGMISIDLDVLPGFRRGGVGSALFARAEEHCRAIGGLRAMGGTIDEAGLAFAEARGFTRSRVARISRCVLDELPAEIRAPEGVRLLALSEVDDLRAVHDSDTLTVGDIPGDAPVAPFTFEEWNARLMADPRMDHDLSTVAVVGDTVAAMTYLQRVGDRVHSSYTATHPGHRGHGYATLVKSRSLHAAKAAGATVAFTSNDAKNAPMLAVNTRLGYAPFADRTTLRREGSNSVPPAALGVAGW